MTNADYRLIFDKLSFEDFHGACPSNFLINGFEKIYSGDYSRFVKELDFEAFQLPVHPDHFTEENWSDLQDYYSDLCSEEAEHRAFLKHPSSIDPINY